MTPSHRVRRRHAALAAGTIAATTAALLTFGPPPSTHRPHPTTNAAPYSQAPAPQRPGRHRVGRPVRGDADVHSRHAVETGRERRVARRFLRAFCRYELGDTSPAVRRKLRATAAAPLADTLIAHPPRSPAGTAAPRAPARVAALELLGTDGTTTELEALLTRPSAPPTPLTVVLRAAHGRPYVAALR